MNYSVSFMVLVILLAASGCVSGNTSPGSSHAQTTPRVSAPTMITAATPAVTAIPMPTPVEPAPAPGMWDGDVRTIDQYYYYDCTHTFDTANAEKLKGITIKCPDGTSVPYLARPGTVPQTQRVVFFTNE